MMYLLPERGRTARLCMSHRRALVCALVALTAPVTGCEGLALFLFGGSAPPATIGLQLVAQGLVAPVGLVAPPDGSNRLFVLDQVGQIRIIDANGNLLPDPFIDLSVRMVTVGIDFGGGIVFDERGLLGLAFHPDYATNGRFFVFYTAPKQADIPADYDSETHVSEFRVLAGDPNRADATSERILLRIGKPAFNHNGGQLAFGPDGYLYIGVGDGGNANDDGTGHNPMIGNAQDKSTLLGKILRIDVDSGDPYAIPPTNPFAGAAEARPEIFAWGFRNPWRFSFEEGGLERLFVADVGQDLFEEVNIVTSGGNYGWRIREGAGCFDKDSPGNPPADCPTTALDGTPLVGPIVQYPHADPAGGPQGIAAIGGYLYRGNAIPALHGNYVFGDFSRGFVFADGSIFAATAQPLGGWTLSELGVAGGANNRVGRFILAFGEDAAGELYVLSSANVGPTGTTGQVHRIVAVP